MIPLLQTTTCANIGNSITNSFTCIGDYIFWSDINMLAIFTIIALAYLGTMARVPAAVMFVFGFGVILFMFWIFDIRVFLALIVMAIIFAAAQINAAYFKGPKDATQ